MVPAFGPKAKSETSATAAPYQVSKTAVKDSNTSKAKAASSSDSAASSSDTHETGSSGRWDPPTGKQGKAGAEKMFPGIGKGIFWPKMPCLRCGCPWWLGEDWDAKCCRCGWDCERSGYDDDSQPLAKYRGKWEQFSKLIADGRTADWAGKDSKPASAKPKKRVI